MNLCQRTILLNAGGIEMDDHSQKVIQRYLETGNKANGEVIWLDSGKAPGNDIVRLHAVRILQDGQSGPTADVDISQDVSVQITDWNLKEGALLYTTMLLNDQAGTLIFATSNHKFVSLTDDTWYGKPQPKGLFQSVCRIPGNFLNEGVYNITAIVGRAIAETQVMEKSVISFNVHDSGEMRKAGFYGGWAGVLRPRLAWHTEYMGETQF